MKCRLCNSNSIKMIYCGKIRNGSIGKYTEQAIPIYQCEECKVIWHDQKNQNIEQYYESTQYRDLLEGSSDIEDFYKLHDKETMAKFVYTGTERFRHKVVADIGCGGGAFLDYLSGVAMEVVAVEPSAYYRKIMKNKGYNTYPYAADAIVDWKGKVDVCVSFDVIEHVEEPMEFLQDVGQLLSKEGTAIIGTPTDAPIMRQVLGEVYERKLLFSTQHLWIFSDENLRMMAEKIGFSQIEVRYYQRYGLGNLIGWLKQQNACGYGEEYSFVSNTMDMVWKQEVCNKGLSDYIVLYLRK